MDERTSAQGLGQDAEGTTADNAPFAVSIVAAVTPAAEPETTAAAAAELVEAIAGAEAVATPTTAAPDFAPTHPAHDDDRRRDEPRSAEPVFDELEHGIASIFAALQAEGEADRDAATDAAPEPAAERDEGLTFLLLGELDRLWRRSSP